MSLALTRYSVAVANDGLDLDKALEAGEPDGYQVHTVTVLHADQLVAEQAAPRYGLPPLGEESTQKMTWATLWCWCGLRRMQITVPEFPVFKGRLLNLDPIKEVPEDLDPTGPTDPPPDIGFP